jgi:hypothetical protein
MIRARITVGTVAVSTVLLFAACGKEDGPGSPPPTEPPATETTDAAPPDREGTRPRDESAALLAEISTPETVVIREWGATESNVEEVSATVTLDGFPIVGALVEVDGYRLPSPTDAEGRFVHPVDATLAKRHQVRVVDVASATVDGYRISEEEAAALDAAAGWINVTYEVLDLGTEKLADGNVRVSGRLAFASGEPPPPVALTSYRLIGLVTDAEGAVVQGAVVSVRTADQGFWTFSEPTDTRGAYAMVFGASDQVGSDPVPMTVRVSIGEESVSYLFEERALFERLASSRMDIMVPPEGFAPALPLPETFPGAVYQGVVVGLSIDGQAATPIENAWPDEEGRFEFILAAGFSGSSLPLFVTPVEIFSAEGGPGVRIDPITWPVELDPSWPQELFPVDFP